MSGASPKLANFLKEASRRVKIAKYGTASVYLPKITRSPEIVSTYVNRLPLSPKEGSAVAIAKGFRREHDSCFHALIGSASRIRRILDRCFMLACSEASTTSAVESNILETYPWLGTEAGSKQIGHEKRPQTQEGPSFEPEKPHNGA